MGAAPVGAAPVGAVPVTVPATYRQFTSGVGNLIVYF